MTEKQSQHVPAVRALRPPVPTALTGAASSAQVATSRAWMFCSVITSPESARSRPHARSRMSGSAGFSFSHFAWSPQVGPQKYVASAETIAADVAVLRRA